MRARLSRLSRISALGGRIARRTSLGTRLSIAAALAVAIAVALASTASYVAVRAKLRGQVDSALQNRAEIVDNVRGLAADRIVEQLADAVKVRRRRRPTKPTAAAREQRLDDKRRRGNTKRLRRNLDE